jgi:hypothetical protein
MVSGAISGEEMFRIRRIYDDVLPADKEAIRQVQKIVRDQFPLLSDYTVVELSEALREPLKYRFRSLGINVRNFFVGLWEGHNARSYRRAMAG